ncbi:MAG TPA: RidA family protein [Gemmatimonadaceae bacterium]|nr:RidA family protein [Gemmatimonadaceae bacterium]
MSLHVVSRSRAVSRPAWLLLGGALAMVAATSAGAQGTPPEKVEFAGGANSPISSLVALPANAAVVWTSGTVPGFADRSAPAGARARYGDTKTQAISVLQRIEALLKERGLGMKDVVYLRAYLVPDKEKGGTIDTQGWNEAYGQFFNTAANPTKPARSTVGVSALVNADWLIEIEAFAAYPAPPR